MVLQQIPMEFLKRAASNPKILGPLLISTVGAQNANQIMNALSNNEIPFDDVLNILTGSPISSVVNQMQDTPAGAVYAPKESDIEAERKFNEELNKRVTLPSEISIDQILSTPETTTKPEPLITPDVPEQKTKVEDVGMTSAPTPRLEDMIMTILEPPENPSDEEKEIQERLNKELFDGPIIDYVKGDPNINYKQKAIDSGDYAGDTVKGKFWSFDVGRSFPGGGTQYRNRVLTYMKPGDFLKLADEKDFNNVASKTALRLYENTNTGLTVPFLNSRLNEDGKIEISGHEGRHRAEYVRRLDPDTPIPVYITVSPPEGSKPFVNQDTYDFGRSLTEAGDILLDADFINEEGKPVDIKILGYDIEGKKAGEFFGKAENITNQIFSGPDFISQDIKVTGSGKNNKILVNDILTFLDSGKTRDLYNSEDFKSAINEAVSEIEYQLTQDITGKGWYDEDIKKSMDVLEKINPKVIEDPLLKELSLFLTGIASAMTPVGADFKIAIQMINNFTETGKLPPTNPVTGKQWNRNTNLKRQIDFAQKLIDQKGLEGFMSFLFEPISRREINALRKDLANLGAIDPKLDIKSGETIGIDDKRMYGTDAFGPKLGPFLANLHGQSDNNVIDIWNVRGMNRRFGNMFVRDKDGNILTNKEGNIMVADQPRSQKERAQFIRFMNEVSSLTNLSVRDAQAILWYYEQGLYTKLGVPSEPKKYSEVAQKFLEEQSNVSSGSLSSSDGTKNQINVSKKKQGGYVIPLPEIDML